MALRSGPGHTKLLTSVMTIQDCCPSRLRFDLGRNLDGVGWIGRRRMRHRHDGHNGDALPHLPVKNDYAWPVLDAALSGVTMFTGPEIGIADDAARMGQRKRHAQDLSSR